MMMAVAEVEGDGPEKGEREKSYTQMDRRCKVQGYEKPKSRRMLNHNSLRIGSRWRREEEKRRIKKSR